MRITLTHHARLRMIQRKVSESQIAETLESPDELLAGDSGEAIAIKRFGVREVRVVYRETDDGSFLVFTVIKPFVHDREAEV